MRFQKAVNVWDMTSEQIQALQPGQWVYAGNPQDKGRFLGVKRSGSVVVAWLGNERSQGDRAKRVEYIRTLRQYAKGV